MRSSLNIKSQKDSHSHMFKNYGNINKAIRVYCCINCHRLYSYLEFFIYLFFCINKTNIYKYTVIKVIYLIRFLYFFFIFVLKDNRNFEIKKTNSEHCNSWINCVYAKLDDDQNLNGFLDGFTTFLVLDND